MSEMPALETVRAEGLADDEIVRRILQGERHLFELLMRRHNQRIYRTVRSILRDDSESEDVMQDAYVRAYEHLGRFEGRAQFSTWLTRIAVNVALRRLEGRGKLDSLDEEAPGGEDGTMPAFHSISPDPEHSASRSELKNLLEEAILALPYTYRTVIVLRDVEEMSTADTAEVLSLTESNVKVRLHRAHELLRAELFARAGASSAQAFCFPATRCDRVVRAVFERLEAEPGEIAS
jgi:RNA polymerase sigma-70 factor, ECF subfamily